MNSETSKPGQLQLPKHDPKLLEESTRRARSFYKSDHELSQNDRQRLSSYFWQRMTIYPALALPVVAGTIVTPNLLIKRGIASNNIKKYGLLQIGMGFMGLVIGLQFSGDVAEWVQTIQLGNREAAVNCYRELAPFPPQVGARYYSMTAKQPEMIMPDPETIDWAQNPLFPMYLIMNQKIIRKAREMEHEHKDTHFRRVNGFQQQHDEKSGKQPQLSQQQPQLQQNQQQQNQQCDDTSLTGTSWDKVIRGQVNSQSLPKDVQWYDKQYDSNSGLDKPFKDTPAYNDPFRVEDSALSKDQKRFDELLEQERRKAAQDSFTQTEKKW